MNSIPDSLRPLVDESLLGSAEADEGGRPVRPQYAFVVDTRRQLNAVLDFSSDRGGFSKPVGKLTSSGSYDYSQSFLDKNGFCGWTAVRRPIRGTKGVDDLASCVSVNVEAGYADVRGPVLISAFSQFVLRASMGRWRNGVSLTTDAELFATLAGTGGTSDEGHGVHDGLMAGVWYQGNGESLVENYPDPTPYFDHTIYGKINPDAIGLSVAGRGGAGMGLLGARVRLFPNPEQTVRTIWTFGGNGQSPEDAFLEFLKVNSQLNALNFRLFQDAQDCGDAYPQMFIDAGEFMDRHAREQARAHGKVLPVRSNAEFVVAVDFAFLKRENSPEEVIIEWCQANELPIDNVEIASDPLTFSSARLAAPSHLRQLIKTYSAKGRGNLLSMSTDPAFKATNLPLLMEWGPKYYNAYRTLMEPLHRRDGTPIHPYSTGGLYGHFCGLPVMTRRGLRDQARYTPHARPDMDPSIPEHRTAFELYNHTVSTLNHELLLFERGEGQGEVRKRAEKGATTSDAKDFNVLTPEERAWNKAIFDKVDPQRRLFIGQFERYAV